MKSSVREVAAGAEPSSACKFLCDELAGPLARCLDEDASVREETDEALQWIARSQAQEGRIDAARQTANTIENAAIKNVALLQIAAALWKSGDRQATEKLVDLVHGE